MSLKTNHYKTINTVIVVLIIITIIKFTLHEKLKGVVITLHHKFCLL